MLLLCPAPDATVKPLHCPVDLRRQELPYLGQSLLRLDLNHRLPRKTPAYYLSFLREGRTVQQYVRLRTVSKVRPRTQAWSEYYHLLARWVKLNQQLADIWRELGQAQADEPSADENG